MAQHLYYYFPSAGRGSGQILDGIVDFLNNGVRPGAQLAGVGTGPASTVATLMIDGEDSGILLRAEVGDRLKDSQWLFIRDLPNAPPLGNASASVGVVLTGVDSLGVFSFVQDYLVRVLGAAEYDEASGFTVRP